MFLQISMIISNKKYLRKLFLSRIPSVFFLIAQIHKQFLTLNSVGTKAEEYEMSHVVVLLKIELYYVIELIFKSIANKLLIRLF